MSCKFTTPTEHKSCFSCSPLESFPIAVMNQGFAPNLPIASTTFLDTPSVLRDSQYNTK